MFIEYIAYYICNKVSIGWTIYFPQGRCYPPPSYRSYFELICVVIQVHVALASFAQKNHLMCAVQGLKCQEPVLISVKCRTIPSPSKFIILKIPSSQVKMSDEWWSFHSFPISLTSLLYIILASFLILLFILALNNPTVHNWDVKRTTNNYITYLSK